MKQNTTVSSEGNYIWRWKCKWIENECLSKNRFLLQRAFSVIVGWIWVFHCLCVCWLQLSLSFTTLFLNCQSLQPQPHSINYSPKWTTKSIIASSILCAALRKLIEAHAIVIGFHFLLTLALAHKLVKMLKKKTFPFFVLCFIQAIQMSS